MSVRVRIQKWGSNLAVCIPGALAEQMGFGFGLEAEMSVEDGALVLRPRPPAEYSLEQLVAQMSGENLQHEASGQEPSGQEPGGQEPGGEGAGGQQPGPQQPGGQEPPAEESW
jgi:antitoxin component of MazEF toxin-antitoxin module